jgi:8-oxo-dGTP pyrophosphatase MutT (NUDIX family)
MIHMDSKESCIGFARELSEETGIDQYELQFTEREWKKTSMQYFME